MRRRIYCEHLPTAELGAATTVDLLTRFSLEPIVAVPPGAQTSAMAEALLRLSRAGIRVGLWPLLSDADGYWPSELTAVRFAERVDEVLQFAGEAGASVTTIAVDLEPPLGVTRALLAGSIGSRARTFVGEYRALRDPQRGAERRAAIEAFTRLRARLDAAGIETLAAAFPHVAVDLASGGRFWQAMLRTPVTAPGWSVISVMLYSTILATQVPPPRGLGAELALWQGACAVATSVDQPRAGVSIGLVGAGKLGDEPIYAGPHELERDVALARAAGVDDLALFSLEGVLGRGDPDQWLRSYVQTGPRSPSAPVTLAGSISLGAARFLSTAFRRR